jgi:hypothetical protein
VPQSRPTEDLSVGGVARGVVWRDVAILTIFAWLGLISCFEAWHRWDGNRPTVSDSSDLWHFWRQRVYGSDGKVIVLLGTSRIAADVRLSTISKRLTDYRVVQLGFDGAVSPIGSLLDLTSDPRFSGIIICELDTPLLDRATWMDPAGHRAHHPSPGFAHFDRLAEAWLESKLVCFQGQFGLKKTICRALWFEPLNQQRPVYTTFERESQFVFSHVANCEELRRRMTQEKAREYESHRFPNWKDLTRDVQMVDRAVRSLQQRGGNVVFLRAPSTGDRWRLEEQYHPRSSNWDRWAASSSAVTIHFRDSTEMRSLVCPDDSHLDTYDSPRFTAALIEQLLERRVVQDTTKKADLSLSQQISQGAVSERTAIGMGSATADEG